MQVKYKIGDYFLNINNEDEYVAGIIVGTDRGKNIIIIDYNMLFTNSTSELISTRCFYLDSAFDNNNKIFKDYKELLKELVIYSL